MKCIRGDNLNESQLEQVKAAFVFRFTAIGKDKYYPTESAWIKLHAFYFKKNGQLASKPNHCVPHYMAK
jgi:hypothetical protein